MEMSHLFICTFVSFVSHHSFILVTDLLRSVMAAAALATSRGVTVSTSIKGLFLMFTLLYLVCLSSSLIDKDQLEQLRENYQKTKQQMEALKADYEESMGFTSELLSQFMSFLDPMSTWMKKIQEESADDDDFPPLDSFMESVKNYMEKTKNYNDRKNKELGGKIKESEKKLEKMKKIIELFEEQQAEL